MPIALLNPYWELRVAALLVENGGYALMGVILIHMAAWLAPEDLGLSARCRQIRGLAVAVTIGYLLLIPLQPVATLTSLANQASIQASERRKIEQQFAEWRSALNNASNVQELRIRFKALKGPEIAEADSALSWSRQRQQLFEGLNKARADALNAQSGPSNVQIWEIVQVSLRRMMLAFALALGFAAAAESQHSEGTLLHRCLEAFEKYRLHRAWGREQRRQQQEQRQWWQQNVRAVEQSRREQPELVSAEPGGDQFLPGLQYTFAFMQLPAEDSDQSLELTEHSNDFKFASVEDADFVVEITISSDDSCELMFTRPVQITGFIVADGIDSGHEQEISFSRGGDVVFCSVAAWHAGFHDDLADLLFLEQGESLAMNGVGPLLSGAQSGLTGSWLPLAAITVVVPPPSLRAALKEELEYWKTRLAWWRQKE